VTSDLALRDPFRGPKTSAQRPQALPWGDPPTLAGHVGPWGSPYVELSTHTDPHYFSKLLPPAMIHYTELQSFKNNRATYEPGHVAIPESVLKSILKIKFSQKNFRRIFQNFLPIYIEWS